MSRSLMFAFTVFNHAMFLAVYAVFMLFVGGIDLLPKTIDGPETYALALALPVNIGLLALFGVQHSVMARPAFKRWWTRFVPRQIERSVYVLITNVLLILIMAAWMPMGPVVWDPQSPIVRGLLWGLFAVGWLIVPAATLMTSHFDLFGTRQGWLHLKKKPYEPLPFKVRGFYRLVRHPLYVGWIIAFFAIPTMTAGHLLFATLMTTYILIAIRFEERDLTNHFGDKYTEYKRSVRGLIPRLGSAPTMGAGAPAV
ncbi:MAG: isoprenylcysteine carboxylmethyltransferase family protein [Planctomycetota bacterium]|nr:isoprenylcysteine carboxylmethyltransferase family protein [Planctomycetota bacterium]